MTDYEINAIRYEVLIPVFDKICEMEYAVVKGEALSLASYNQLGCRTSNDVDILTVKENVYDIEKILCDNGFSSDVEESENARQKRIFMMANTHQTIPYAKEYKGIVVRVDVNFGILWGEYNGPRIDIHDFLADAETVVIHNAHVKVLSKEKTLIHLGLHNYKDVNSTYLLLRRKRPIYERVYKEFYKVAESCTCNQLDSIVELSKALHVDSYMFYMAYYANIIFPSAKLERLISALRSNEGEKLLPTYGLAEGERHIWTCSFEERYNYLEMKDFILNQLGAEEVQKLKINGLYYKEVEALYEQ